MRVDRIFLVAPPPKTPMIFVCLGETEIERAQWREKEIIQYVSYNLYDRLEAKIKYFVRYIHINIS